MSVDYRPAVGPLGYWVGAFRKYATFSGRARRAEYWWFTLFNVLLYAAVVAIGFGIAGAFDNEVIPGALIFFYLVGALVPTLAITSRRLHDAGLTGWLQLIGIIPLLSVVVLVLTILPGSQGANQYGPDPRGY